MAIFGHADFDHGDSVLLHERHATKRGRANGRDEESVPVGKISAVNDWVHFVDRSRWFSHVLVV